MRITVGRRIFQDIGKYPGYLIRIGPDCQILIHLQCHKIAVRFQHGRDLITKLHQHIVKIDPLPGEPDLSRIQTRDLKKLIYHLFQAVRLFQRYMHMLRPLRCRHIRIFFQQIQITDH